jgi:8-oxo-dGTP diphosphatase
MQKYAAGFLIDPDRQQVVLLKKAKPTWQAGRYNAVGGKVEPGETPVEAMRREFLEEAGVDVPLSSWEKFVFMEGPGWECSFFRAWGDPLKCYTTDPIEPIEVFKVDTVKVMTSEQAISNVPWLLGIALNTSGGLALPVKVNYQ